MAFLLIQMTLLAKHEICNELLNIPPSRGNYFRYLVFFKILGNELIDLPSVCELMNIVDDEN